MDSKTRNADRIFNKRCTLKSNNDVYHLPGIDAMFSTESFEVESLTKMRDELNETKSLLNDKDIEQWRRHTRKTNPCGLVVKQLREQVNPELCTQAWAKFCEIVSTCDVVPASCIDNKSLNSLHLCEAPGAFIACLNHYIKSKCGGLERPEMEWTWLATTLNPFYEGNDTKRMIEGERFILETQEHWNFGEYFDGDIMNWKNLENLQQAMEKFGKADIITADGSIDCADEPEKQETTIGQLFFCEVVAALTLLAPGGSFVVKMFTMFEHNTICVLYLLCCFFTKIEIIKPGTSKAGNSEVYCVCTSFTGTQYLSEELLEKLRLCYTCESPVRSLFPRDMLPANFLKSIEGCAKTFSGYQTDAIKKNIDLFENSTKGKRRFLSKLREHVAVEYMRRFDVIVLDRSFSVVSRTHLTGSQLSCWPDVAQDVYHNTGHHSGCYQERMEMADLSWQDRVVFPRDQFCSFKNEEELIQDLIHDEPIRWLSSPSSKVLKSDIANWTIRLGNSIGKVQSSRFCPSALIEELDEARTNATVLQQQEGRDWMEKVEQLSMQERLCSGVSLLHNTMDSLLRKCDLLNNQSETRFVDISGDCRFLCELVDCGFCQPELCSGLLCSNCSTQYAPDSPLSKFVAIANSCLGHTGDEASRLKNICHKEDGSVNVIFGTVFTACGSNGDGELTKRATFVNQCLVAVKLLRDGESFVCEVSDTLTQFTAGIIYILHLLFKETSLSPVVGKLRCSQKQFLVCRSYISANNIGFTEHLADIIEALEKKTCDQDVVCLVPISNLFSELFYKYMRGHTTGRVRSQLNFIIDLERIWLEQHVIES